MSKRELVRSKNVDIHYVKLLDAQTKLNESVSTVKLENVARKPMKINH